MPTFKPVGARILVKDIVTSLSIVERGKRAGIEVIVEDDNKPRATQGEVIALGNDPLVHELVKPGDIVYFNWHSGHHVYLEDEEFRMLELQDVTAVMETRQASDPPIPDLTGVKEQIG